MIADMPAVTLIIHTLLSPYIRSTLQRQSWTRTQKMNYLNRDYSKCVIAAVLRK